MNKDNIKKFYDNLRFKWQKLTISQKFSVIFMVSSLLIIPVGVLVALNPIAFLTSRGAPITPPQTPEPTVAIIIDNSGATFTGSWLTYTNSDVPVYGNDAKYKAPSSSGAGKARFSWTFEESGQYEVSVWTFKHPYLATNMPFTVVSEDGSKLTKLNLRGQISQTGDWTSLGTYNFLAGKNYYVEVSDRADGVVLADAVSFEILKNSPSPSPIYSSTPSPSSDPTSTPSPSSSPTAKYPVIYTDNLHSGRWLRPYEETIAAADPGEKTGLSMVISPPSSLGLKQGSCNSIDPREIRCKLVGTPNAPGNYNILITATNSKGETTQKYLPLKITLY